jgi:2-isopropylmalate synthase
MTNPNPNDFSLQMVAEDDTDTSVYVFDTTMRDGEQSPGIAFGVQDKIDIARALIKVGVNVIEAGFPRNRADYDTVQAVAENIGSISLEQGVESPVVCGLARADIEDIDFCWRAIKQAPRTRIHTFIATSPIHMEKKLRLHPNQVRKLAGRAVEYACGLTDDVQFSAEDATRSDIDFLLSVIETVIKAGAKTVNIPDTTGYITPEEYQILIGQVVEFVNNLDPTVRVSAHCHDDLGMATANSLAAIVAGARQVECTINGIGERAGNAALEEIIAALVVRKALFKASTTINTKELSTASRLVSDLSGYPVSFNKAVVGRNAFTHESGIHQAGMLNDPKTYEILDPKDFGQESSLVIGKHSGRKGIESISS